MTVRRRRSLSAGRTRTRLRRRCLATEVGTYTWSASYAGDGLNNGAIDNGKNESVCIVASSPSIVTTPSDRRHDRHFVRSADGFRDALRRLEPWRLDHVHAVRPGLQDPGGHGDGERHRRRDLHDAQGIHTALERPTPGVYQWDATYSGDGKNAMATDANNTLGAGPGCHSVLQPLEHLVLGYDNGTITTTTTDLGGNTQQGDTVIANFTVPAGVLRRVHARDLYCAGVVVQRRRREPADVVSSRHRVLRTGGAYARPVTIPGRSTRSTSSVVR